MTTLGLAATGCALMIVAVWLRRRWRRPQGAMPDSWFQRELLEHEKEEKRASGLSGLM